MAEDNREPEEGEDEDLQFSAVEGATPGQVVSAPQCVVCKRPIADQYFTAGDKVICPDCRNQYEATVQGGSKLWRFVKATALGLVAGLVGAAVWVGIWYWKQKIYALVAIGVGLLVGGAVRLGSERRGGRGYQFLAIMLTYLALGVGLTPKLIMEVAEEFKKNHPSQSLVAQAGPATAPAARETAATQAKTQPFSAATTSRASNDDDTDDQKAFSGAGLIVGIIAGLILLVGAVLVAPIGVALSSIIGAVIIGIALWEAWKMNALRRLSLAGPYSLAGNPPQDPRTLPPVAPGGQG